MKDYWAELIVLVLLVFTVLLNLTGSGTGAVVYEPFSLELSKGWNFISLPFDDADVLGWDDCEVKTVQGSKLFHFIPDRDSYTDQHSAELDFKGGKGYWIKIGKSCTLTVTGLKPVEVEHFKNLKPGFNMIGSPFDEKRMEWVKGNCQLGPMYSYSNSQEKWVKHFGTYQEEGEKKFDLLESIPEKGKGYFLWAYNECELNDPQVGSNDETAGDGVGVGNGAGDGTGTNEGSQGTALDGWTCDPSMYGDGFCDEECGINDLDCEEDDGDPQLTDTIPEKWICAEQFYNDEECNCGCGAKDSDCTEPQQCEGISNSGFGEDNSDEGGGSGSGTGLSTTVEVKAFTRSSNLVLLVGNEDELTELETHWQSELESSGIDLLNYEDVTSEILTEFIEIYILEYRSELSASVLQDAYDAGSELFLIGDGARYTDEVNP